MSDIQSVIEKVQKLRSSGASRGATTCTRWDRYGRRRGDGTMIEHMVLVRRQTGARYGLSEAQLAAYADGFANEAEERCSHPWVTRPSDRLLRAVRDVWDVIAPGWTHDRSRPSSDENLRALIAHSAIFHHLRMIGVEVPHT